MPMIWTTENWLDFTWSAKRVMPVAFDLTAKLGEVRGRIMALPETRRAEVWRDIMASEVIASAKIDKWRIRAPDVVDALTYRGDGAPGRGGVLYERAEGLCQSHYTMLRYPEPGRTLRDVCGLHPEVARLSWSFPGAPMALRDDATLAPEDAPPVACPPSGGVLDQFRRLIGRVGAPGPDAVSAAAAIHLGVALLRPFARANGVMARLLSQAVLRTHGGEVPIVAPVSAAILDDREGYFAGLGRAAWGSRDITDFVLWHHDRVAKSLRVAEAHIRRAEVHERLGLGRVQVTAKEHTVLTVLVERQEPMSVRKIAEMTGASRTWLFRLLTGLEARGVVQSEGPAHQRVYHLTRDWRCSARAF